jgi:hypothetical protein
LVRVPSQLSKTTVWRAILSHFDVAAVGGTKMAGFKGQLSLGEVADQARLSVL